LSSPTLSDLPAPPPGKTGWPWTEACDLLPELRPDGSPWPRITIVTPSFNQGEFIEETIRSVLLQGYPNLEYFVMDGGSTDESVEIIKRYASWIDYWESGPDDGQAAAINKGLARATGYWFHNINSDDVILRNGLLSIGSSTKECDALASDVVVFDDTGEWVSANRNLTALKLIQTRPKGLAWHQPGVIFQTSKLREINGYPTDLYLFDMYSTARYLEKWPQICYLEEKVVKFRVHALAQTSLTQTRTLGHFVKMRVSLSKTLSSQYLRNLSRLEAVRSEIEQLLLNQNGEHYRNNEKVWTALKLAAQRNPSLLFDRVLLAGVKQACFPAKSIPKGKS